MIHINIIKEEKNNSYNILKAEEIEKKEKNTQFKKILQKTKKRKKKKQ